MSGSRIGPSHPFCWPGASKFSHPLPRYQLAKTYNFSTLFIIRAFCSSKDIFTNFGIGALFLLFVPFSTEVA